VGHDAALLAEFTRRRPLAVGMARRFMRKLPRSVDAGDIQQAALIGLWDALTLHRVNAREDEGLEGYLRVRIRGAIIDELRAQDWLPRRHRQKHGPDGSQPERRIIVHLDDLPGDWSDYLGDGRPTADAVMVAHSEAALALRAPLTATDRRCVDLIVFRGVRMVDVAAELGCSEARVCQRFGRALQIMRAHLTGEFPPTTGKRGLSEAVKLRILEQQAKEGRRK
jgi:RNA polymerase sigma factor for flagellar operon FliA